jgi:hypothetical protein
MGATKSTRIAAANDSLPKFMEPRIRVYGMGLGQNLVFDLGV